MARRPLFSMMLGVCATLWMLATPGGAQAQRRIPVRIESQPSGATVHLDSADGRNLGKTPIAVARIPRGQHTLIFQLDNHQDARLTVNIRRRRETFRAVLKPMGTLVVSAGNEAAKGAAVVVDGEPVGNIPYEGELKPGRHQVKVKREGHTTFEKWVNLEGGQVFTIPASLEKKAPPAGSILVAGDISGAPVFLDGEERGKTPAVLEDVPEGAHELEIRPEGRDVFKRTIEVREGERTRVSPTLREKEQKGGAVRVITTPSDAMVRVDGEEVGRSPTTAEGLSPGDHIIEAHLEGHKRASKQVTVESDRQRIVSMELDKKEPEPGRIVVNATVEGAQVSIDGEDRGAPPVVIKRAEPGPHGIVVTAPGYEDFRTTCEVDAGKDCDVMARMEPVGTPVRVESNVRGAELYVDGENKGPVPWEGSLPVGSHRIEVRARGYEPHIAQVALRPSSEARAINAELVRHGAATPEERAKEMQEKMERFRETVSFSANTLREGMTMLDVSVGWPYLAEARLGVGILDFLDAGFAFRTFGRLNEFEGRVKAGWRPIEQISIGGQARFGGGIGITRGATQGEKDLADMLDDAEAKDHPTNSVFFNLELLMTLHFARAGAVSIWVAGDFYSDRWDWCGSNADKFPNGSSSDCKSVSSSDMELPSRGRRNNARLRFGGALEIVVSTRWNLWTSLEGIVLDNTDRAVYGDIFGLGKDDTEVYYRLGLSYKFGDTRHGWNEEKPSKSNSSSKQGQGNGGRLAPPGPASPSSTGSRPAGSPSSRPASPSSTGLRPTSPSSGSRPATPPPR